MGYDANDLLSTLLYMKKQFGIDVFHDAKKMNSILGDLSPTLKRDGRILQRLLMAGLFQELEETDFTNEMEKLRARGRVKNWLIDEEFIQEEKAVYYSQVLCTVYEEVCEGTVCLKKNEKSDLEHVSEKEKEIELLNRFRQELVKVLAQRVEDMASEELVQNQSEELKKRTDNLIKKEIVYDNSSQFIIEKGVLKHYMGYEKRVVVPEGISVIGNAAFLDCDFLEEIEFHEGIQEIDALAFQRCRELKEVILPESITEIGEAAFSECCSLENINIPEGMQQIGYGVFSACSSLESIKIPKSVRIIHSEAFALCTNLINLTIPQSICTISENAFRGCVNLKMVEIPEDVVVQKNAFPIETILIRVSAKVSTIFEERTDKETYAKVVQEFENKDKSSADTVALKTPEIYDEWIDKLLTEYEEDKEKQKKIPVTSLNYTEKNFADLVRSRHPFVPEEHLEHTIAIEKADILSRLIAVGDKHSVAVKSDGTVIAKGENKHGQCSVEHWKDICMVAVAKNYTIGLKTDGNVVYTGKFSKAEAFELSHWTDIVDISASESHIIGLKQDGTVVVVGEKSYHEGTKSLEWKNIVSVVAGYDFIAGVTLEGQVVACGGSYFGKSDTKSFSNKNIISISGSDRMICGVTSEGKVFAAGFREKDGKKIPYQECLQLNQYEKMLYVTIDWVDFTGICRDGVNLLTTSILHRIQRYQKLIAIKLGKYHDLGITSDGVVVVASAKIFSSKCNRKVDISGEQLFSCSSEAYEKIWKLRAKVKI